MILKIYSNRWNHFDHYKITKNQSGWIINFMSIGGQCDNNGYPFLYKNLDHDCINYPEDLPQRLEHIWENAELNNHDDTTIQLHLNELSQILEDFEIKNPLS